MDNNGRIEASQLWVAILGIVAALLSTGPLRAEAPGLGVGDEPLPVGIGAPLPRPLELTPEQQAAALSTLAAELGIDAGRLEITFHEDRELTLTRAAFRHLKVLDRETGEGHTLVLDASGRPVDRMELEREEELAKRDAYGRMTPELRQRLDGSRSDDRHEVSIWVKHDPTALVPPRPSPKQLRSMTPEERDAAKRERVEQLIANHADVQQPLLDWLRTRGVFARAGQLAPLVTVDAPRFLIEQLAGRPEVQSVSLTGVGGIAVEEERYLQSITRAAVARQTEKADIVAGRGIDGDGASVAVVEVGSISNVNPYLNNFTHPVLYQRSLTDAPIATHPTAVAGRIASTHPTLRGSAPGISLIHNGNTTNWGLSALDSALSWAIGQGSDASNHSYWTSDPNAAIWADYMVRASADVFVTISGNFGTSEGTNVTNPGTGHNVITVGNLFDNNTADWDDDSIATSSGFRAPAGLYKPEVVAVGMFLDGTTTSSPWTGSIGSGTSYASPAVAGLAALLQDRDPGLLSWPEAVKAIIIASALNNVEGSSSRSLYDGAGGVDMAAADLIAAEQFWAARSVSGSSFDENRRLVIDTVQIDAGERFRAALAFDSNPSADYTTNPLEGDLDLRLYNSSGTLVASSSTVYAWEIIDWTATANGTYTIEVYNWASSLTSTESTFMGVAWFPGHQRLEEPVKTFSQPTSAGDAFVVDTSSEAGWWVVAARTGPAQDYDIELFDGSPYGNPAEFDWLEDSRLGAGTEVELVVIDRNHAPAKDYFPIVSVHSGNGAYTIQRNDPSTAFDSGTRSANISPGSVVIPFDIDMQAGESKYFNLVQTSGIANLGMLLFDSNSANPNSYYQGRSQAIRSQDTGGAGDGEFFVHTSDHSDRMGLVVYNRTGQIGNATWTLYVDDTAPNSVIEIQGGASVVNDPDVWIFMNASDPHTGVSEMRFSNNGFVFSDWEPYQSSKLWTLSAGDDGPRTVWVDVRNNAGMLTRRTATLELNACIEPNGVPELKLSKETFGTRLSWSPVSTITDVVYGNLNTLRSSGGAFDVSTEGCLYDDTTLDSTLVALFPGPGEGYWFLARGAECDGGPYETYLSGQVGLRDAEIDAAPSACP